MLCHFCELVIFAKGVYNCSLQVHAVPWLMENGDWLCINMDQQSRYEKFELKCHKISLMDVFAAFVLPDATKEPAPRINLPSTMKGDRGRARTVKLVPRSERVSVGELDQSMQCNYKLKKQNPK